MFCKIHRSDLAGMIGRLKAKEGKVISPSSTVPNRRMTTAQLRQKMVGVQEERRHLKRKNVVLARINGS